MRTETSAAGRWLTTLRWAGLMGAGLALVVLAASILLRMSSRFEPDGVLVSLLPPVLEQSARLVHRLAASTSGVLALLCVVAGIKTRRLHPEFRMPIMVIGVMTLLLAAVGPLTPGYRHDWVTVCNVWGGTILVASYWWLHLLVVNGPTAPTHNIWLRWTLVTWLVHIALGAAASAQYMRGQHWLGFLHSATAMLTAVLLAASLREAWQSRHRPGLVRFLAGAFALQMALGIIALWSDVVPVALGTAHALLSAALALGMVALYATGNHNTV